MKLTRKEKFGYGFGDLSANIIVAAISFYLLYFMVSVAGLYHKRSRLDLTNSQFFDDYSDFFLGDISVKTNLK